MRAQPDVITATWRVAVRLLAALRSGGQPLAAVDAQDVPDAVQAAEAYASTVFQSLALFRFFSFTMGASLIFVLRPSANYDVPLFLYVVVVGLYNVGRVVWRVNPVLPRLVLQWLFLGGDVLLAVVLVMASKGLDSPFLIYSLAPILTASLLMVPGIARVAAGATALPVIGAHLAGGLVLDGYPWILEGNYPAMAVLYGAVCVVIAYLPFLANLNWQRRVRAESRQMERQRLRREVHDNVAQTLAFLSLKMRRAEERTAESRAPLTARDVVDISSAVERAYLAVRDYLDDRHEAVGAISLAAGLASAVDQWSRDTGLPARVASSGEERQLAPRVKLQLIQIAREALANAARHARPTRVWLTVEWADEALLLRVRDDGLGIAPGHPRGLGLTGMQERALLIGASLEIQSDPGKGTEVLVRLPMPEKGAAS